MQDNLVDMKPDASDEALIAILRANARLSTAELARKVGLSRTTVQSRLARLEETGVILRYTVITAPSGGDPIRAHVLITVVPRLSRLVERGLRQMEEVTALHAVSGKVDLIAMIAGRSAQHVNDVIDRIGSIEGVKRTTSSVILSTRFDRGERV